MEILYWHFNITVTYGTCIKASVFTSKTSWDQCMKILTLKIRNDVIVALDDLIVCPIGILCACDTIDCLATLQHLKYKSNCSRLVCLLHEQRATFGDNPQSWLRGLTKVAQK